MCGCTFLAALSSEENQVAADSLSSPEIGARSLKSCALFPANAISLHRRVEPTSSIHAGYGESAAGLGSYALEVRLTAAAIGSARDELSPASTTVEPDPGCQGSGDNM
jgi:hypothetical protein